MKKLFSLLFVSDAEVVLEFVRNLLEDGEIFSSDMMMLYSSMTSTSFNEANAPTRTGDIASPKV
jgi:hypothetical protein